MYLRFITFYRDYHTRYGEGVFTAAYALRDADLLYDWEETWFADTVGWFEKHLRVPSARDLAKLGARADGRRALFWFHASARKHVSRMRGLCALLEEHRIPTRVLRSPSPGIIVFGDRDQVAAIPRRDDVSIAPGARGRLRML
ncbi:MAG: hypothetical protein ABFS86_10870 [Planctomycetota bacterium]